MLSILLRYSIFVVSLFSLIICSEINDTAPGFYLRDLDNTDYFLSDEIENETPILLSFFATWCAPCRLELPLLDSLAITYTDIDVVYIATGSESKPLKTSHIKTFRSELDLDQTILMDKYGRIFDKYTNAGTLPLTVFIDNNGLIVYISEGFDKDKSIEDLTKVILEVLNAK